MEGSVFAGVAVSLILVYLVVSLLCSAVYEYIAAAVSFREQLLNDGLRRAIGSDSLFDQFLESPLVAPLLRGASNRSLPQYMPGEIFANGILSVLASNGHLELLGGQARAIANPANPSPIVNTVLGLAQSVGGDSARLRDELNRWYEQSMTRTSSDYKRWSQFFLVIIAAVVCFTFNIDTYAIAVQAYRDPVLREQSIKAAKETIPKENSGQVGAATRDAIFGGGEAAGSNNAKDNLLFLPIGWKCDGEPLKPGEWLTKILGILVSAVLVSLGAPFWFDALNRFVNVRGAAKPPSAINEPPPHSPPPARATSPVVHPAATGPANAGLPGGVSR